MSTPTHDDQGNELLPDDQYHSLVMMESDEFDAQPDDIKNKFGFTNSWHFQRRMSGVAEGDFQTGDGMSFQEKLAHYRSLKSQRPDPRDPKD